MKRVENGEKLQLKDQKKRQGGRERKLYHAGDVVYVCVCSVIQLLQLVSHAR